MMNKKYFGCNTGVFCDCFVLFPVLVINLFSSWDFNKDIKLWYVQFSFEFLKFYIEIRIGRHE